MISLLTKHVIALVIARVYITPLYVCTLLFDSYCCFLSLTSICTYLYSYAYQCRGGIDYTNTTSAFDLRTMITSGDGVELFNLAMQVCSNIIYILPKNMKKKDLVDLAATTGVYCRIEDVYIHNKLKMIVAYYGPLFSL